MEEAKIKRINELSRKKKTSGLSPEELQEQKELYRLFIDDMKKQVVDQLDGAGIRKKDLNQGDR
jgi:uncharacterized protein YnzC (UPF0291/DUF896 family)